MMCDYGHKVEPNPQGCAHCSRLRLRMLSGSGDLSPDEIREWASLKVLTLSRRARRQVAELEMW